MEIVTLGAALARYWGRLMPVARAEIAHWHARARTIRDPACRQIALAKIREERMNVESAAFFALLAGEHWHVAVRRIVAFQLAYELLDGINEAHPGLDDGLRLHGALIEAIGGVRRDHGGGSYLQELVDACRALTTPSEELLAAAESIGVAQARNHACSGLREWAQRFAPGLLWWEAAAAGISSLTVLALLATPAKTHAHVVPAYTEICALSALLDGLVDYSHDTPANHNWINHYATPHHMADRLVTLAQDAQNALHGLPDEGLHQLLLAGLLAHNLTFSATREDHAREARHRLMKTIRYVRPAVVMLQARARLTRLSRMVLPG
jgi:tetraprenyl-beta-curcumene synthase